MTSTLRINEGMSVEDAVQMYTPYIWTVVRKTVTRANLVVDQHDLFQAGVLALVRALPYKRKEYYLKRAVRNGIFEQANQFYGCFTVSRGVVAKIVDCRRHPENYRMSDPVFRLAFHEVERYA